MMMPRLGGKSRSLPTLMPFTVTLPLSGRRKPQMHFIRTVLPLPLLPTTPAISPGGIERLTSSSTVSFPKDLYTFSTMMPLYSIVSAPSR